MTVTCFSCRTPFAGSMTPPAITIPAAITFQNGRHSRLLASLRTVKPGRGLFHGGLGVTLRQRALREEAISLGAQGGLYYRSQQINRFLKTESVRLSQIFNFTPLLLHGQVLPPLVARMAPTSHLSVHALSMTQVLAVYRILRPARLVAVAPTWQQWLWMPLLPPKPDEIPLALLPHTAKERRWWQKGVYQGWQDGIRQGDRLFQERVRRLRRALLGRLLFLRLANAGLVSVPHLGVGNYGIQVGHHVLREGVRLFRVMAPARFLATAGWRTPVIGARDKSQGARP
ncbi:type IV secretory system conjugative DNA transfer family protein [Acidiferrobacter sp.]|uniref:type IV secretory system conjugative DNA transfer family protein n=1 Tax=Acidiferrobacter sp. TaxID=1872107 RepID=UPI002610423D|nr:type IV secretory system conjugative DNA transfer family protein [Acidiferrobacter sp.]